MDEPFCHAAIRLSRAASRFNGRAYRHCLKPVSEVVTVANQGQFNLCAEHATRFRYSAVRLCLDAYGHETARATAQGLAASPA